MNPRPRLVAGALAPAVLTVTTRWARTRTVSDREERVFRRFNDGPAWVYLPVWAVMQAGSLVAVGVTAATLGWRGRARTATATAVSGIVVWGGVKVIKPLIGRGRPAHHLDDVTVRGQPQSGLGFPSGHAAVSLTLALVATRDLDRPTRAAALTVAAITGGARMYVGAHLPLDILGGYAIGALAAGLTEAVPADPVGIDGPADDDHSRHASTPRSVRRDECRGGPSGPSAEPTRARCGPARPPPTPPTRAAPQ